MAFVMAHHKGNDNTLHRDVSPSMITWDDAGLVSFRAGCAEFPKPVLIVPISGSSRVLNGITEPTKPVAIQYDEDGEEIEAEESEPIEPGYTAGGDGIFQRLYSITKDIKIGHNPLLTYMEQDGGAWVAIRIPPEWIASDDLLRAIILVAYVLQRGGTRPMTAVDDATGLSYSTDELAEQAADTGEFLSTYDVAALDAFCRRKGYRIEAVATLPILAPWKVTPSGAYIVDEDGMAVPQDVWKAIHAFIKYYAVGLGVPRGKYVDNTRAMLKHPTVRALLALGTRAMLALGWDEERVGQCSLTGDFV